MLKIQKFLSSQKFKLSDFQIIQTIGEGYSSRVKAAKCKKTNKIIAIKVINKTIVIKSRQIDHVYNEISIHKLFLHHPFIVNFHNFYQDSRNIYLIMQFINGAQLNGQHCKFYAAIVISVLQSLHSKDILYRDLKPQNLLISKDGYLKLIDFGFSKKLSEGRTYTICGTPEYLAPEIIIQKGHSMAVDWWTLGVLIYQMHTGSTPFEDKDPLRIYKNIIRGVVQYPKVFSKKIKSLVSNLLIADLSKRYGNLKNGVNDIKSHKWFIGLNWNDIQKKKIKAPYIPSIKDENDFSMFEKYPNSINKSIQINEQKDPFIGW